MGGGMNETIAFFVAGRPVAQGNHRMGRRGGVSWLYDATKGLRGWREAVAWQARAAMGAEKQLSGPIVLGLAFYLERPKSHCTATGALKANAPALPAVRPDADKVTRSCADAMTGIIYRDDAQVVELYVQKHYAGDNQAPGVEINVREVA